MPSANHYRWSDIPPDQLNPKFTRQYIIGTDTMLARVTMKKGLLVPMHQHVNEQISHVVEGSILFHLDGVETIVKAGEILCIPPNLPHDALALEDSVALEVFNPPRRDWVAGNDAYLRTAVDGQS